MIEVDKVLLIILFKHHNGITITFLDVLKFGTFVGFYSHQSASYYMNYNHSITKII